MNREFEREIQRPGISLQPYLKWDARQLAGQMGIRQFVELHSLFIDQELARARAVFPFDSYRQLNGLACPLAAAL
jgi:hypothetical protein